MSTARATPTATPLSSGRVLVVGGSTAEHGVQLLEFVTSLRQRGLKVGVKSIAEELLNLGIKPGGKSGENINPLRLWLERAGVISGEWQVNDERLREIVGATVDELGALAGLPLGQRAFLLALACVTGEPPFVASDIRLLAELHTAGVQLDLKTFVKQMLDPLAAAGWIETEKATTGRGGKSHRVAPTSKFLEKMSVPLAEALATQSHLQDPARLRRPLPELLDVVRDTTASTYDRGQALEGICIQIVRLMGVAF